MQITDSADNSVENRIETETSYKPLRVALLGRLDERNGLEYYDAVPSAPAIFVPLRYQNKITDQ
jgi:hypothetical protein